jgi:hypothetical protein
MPFPEFDFCLICDGVRPEMGGKLTLLGFYGIAPNVEVAIGNPAFPLSLAIVAGFPPVLDIRVYDHSFVITDPSGNTIQRTPPSRLHVAPGGRGLVVFGFVMQPPYTFGTYTVRIQINNETKLNTSFRIRSANPAEMPGTQFPPPVAPGRMN